MKKDNPIYKIILGDGSIFNGGNLTNTKWLDIPYNKKIKQVFYKLPSGDALVLNGYDEYYHMVECAEDINGTGKKTIEYTYIMGKKENKVICYKIDLSKNIGCVYTALFKENSDFVKGLNEIGWRKGV